MPNVINALNAGDAITAAKALGCVNINDNDDT